MMLNEPAFVALWAGSNKAGMTASFLNYNLRQKSLLHCIDISEIQALIVGNDDELIQVCGIMVLYMQLSYYQNFPWFVSIIGVYDLFCEYIFYRMFF